MTTSYHANYFTNEIMWQNASNKVENQLRDPNVILNLFFVSVTPYGVVRNWNGGMTEDQLAANHILFQASKNGYIGSLFTSLEN